MLQSKGRWVPGTFAIPWGVKAITGDRYRRMIELCPTGRGGTPDEIGAVGALLMDLTAVSSPAATFSSMAE